MSDQATVSATGKSKEEVAFDLLNKLKGQGVWGERNLSAILDMYAECLLATQGRRNIAPKQVVQPVQQQQQAVQDAFKTS